MSFVTFRRIAAGVGALATVLTVSALPAMAAPTPGQVDPSQVKVTASYSQSNYTSEDTLQLNAVVRNNSSIPLVGVEIWFKSGNCVFGGGNNWGDFGTGHTNIPAGTQQTAQLTGGDPFDAGGGTEACTARLIGGNLDGEVDFTASTMVTVAYGDYHGVVFKDPNGSGKPVSGAGLAGVKVGYTPEGQPAGSVTTDANGEFSITHLPAATYYLKFSSADGWQVNENNTAYVKVTSKPNPTGDFAAVRPLSERLRARVSFDQPDYPKSASTVHLTVTLTNTGGTAIDNVIADCREGGGNAVHPGAGWGALRQPGVTVPAGQSVTLHVSSPMPPTSDPMNKESYVIKAECQFGPEPDGNPQTGFPWAYAGASIDGKTGILRGVLIDKDNHPLPNVKVLALVVDTHTVVGSAVTDGSGDFQFTVPDGMYDVYVVGPWQYLPPYGGRTVVSWGYNPVAQYQVEPGPDQPDLSQSSTPTTTPAPIAGQSTGSGGELANTGVNALWPSVAGLALLVLGAGAVLLSRRRRTA